jgi:bifunctional DNA-binding transcriptional regulator/antitoxin component of YhaV-PrlF toxin-antitoxin module
MSNQDIVNAFRDGFKADWMLTVYYRSQHDRIIKRHYESAQVLRTLAEKYEPGLEPIESIYREITVGTTKQDESNEWKGGIGS